MNKVRKVRLLAKEDWWCDWLLFTSKNSQAFEICRERAKRMLGLRHGKKYILDCSIKVREVK